MSLAPRSLSWEDPELEASVGYIVRLYLPVGICRSTVPREDTICSEGRGRIGEFRMRGNSSLHISSCFLEEMAF